MAESRFLRGKKSADGEYVSDIILSVWGHRPMTLKSSLEWSGFMLARAKVPTELMPLSFIFGSFQ